MKDLICQVVRIEVHGGNPMNKLSDFIITNPQVVNFEELKQVIATAAKNGVLQIDMDIKPDYRNTPRNWAWVLEDVFIRGEV